MTRMGVRVTALGLGLVSGCGYTSSYVPPDARRARAMYVGNEVVVTGADALPQCRAASASAVSTDSSAVPIMALDDNGDWVAGSNVNIVVFGPVHPFPVIFHPGLPPHPPGPHDLILAGVGGDLDGEAALVVAAVLAVAALAASSAVAVGLAASPAERSEESIAAIDAINRHNDEARRIIDQCRRLQLAAAESEGQP